MSGTDCRCGSEKTIVVLSTAAGVETLADKCTTCGHLSNQRTEV